MLATLRSLPRRYRAQLSADPTLDLAALSDRPGRDGRSLVTVLDAAAAAIRSRADGAYRAAVLDGPEVSAAAKSTGARTIDAALAAAIESADHAVEVLSRLTPDSWMRPAKVEGGREATVLEMAQDAARAGVEGLRALEDLVRQFG